MNDGPALLQKASVRSASVFVQSPFLYSVATVFAPTGNPEISPSNIAEEQAPETQKTLRVKGSAYLPVLSAYPLLIKIPERTINGNSVGIRTDRHISIPFSAASQETSGKTRIPTIPQTVSIKTRMLLIRLRAFIFILFPSAIAFSVKMV